MVAGALFARGDKFAEGGQVDERAGFSGIECAVADRDCFVYGGKSPVVCAWMVRCRGRPAAEEGLAVEGGPAVEGTPATPLNN